MYFHHRKLGERSERVEKTADGWTKLRTLDESNIRSSWEIIAWEWKLPDKVVEEEGKEAKEEEQ